ncbi:transcriptional regulator [Roseobacter cerasinus]|uniref:Transcriptional regulator n=1 Tax=Roseobacter cerasinus TaxID=2602289 RepID=A0A640VVC8_9RHOB|nr:GntR family transcriptional regulator [Roseobacter cerasinus]GFE52368.1 transcriptional regulator [Roseobacter cerasinus]
MSKQATWTDDLRAFGAIKPRRSLAEEAADTLREFILLGKLAPGVPVPERDLSEALGISRTPLKEALRQLEGEGLIDYGPTRRPRVADPSMDEISENLAVLGALEALAGELACKNATDAEIAEAARFEEMMRTAPAGTDPLDFFRWDMAFHQTIVRAAGNAPLSETHHAYNSRLWRARFISSKMRTARDATLGQHEDIIAALKARDGAACGQHMRRHLEVAIVNIAAAQARLERQNTT